MVSSLFGGRGGEWAIAKTVLFEFSEAQFTSQLFHDPQAEAQFLFAGMIDLAIGFMDTHELRAILAFFFGCFGGHNDL
jgi:hypothetical protein